MNDHDTTVLTSRLHQLADELALPLDVVGQVRDARAGHQRRRRTRMAVLAAATATTAIVVGTAVAVDQMSADRSGDVAGPSAPSPATTEPAPTTPDPETGPTGLPAGWEPRSFHGVTFGVPPGARSADSVADIPVSSWIDGPSLVWNGPHLGGDLYSSVNVTITETFEGGLPPRDGGRWFTVPGAGSAYGNVETSLMTDGVADAERTVVWLEVLAGDRVVHLDAVFDGGPSGEQMARDLIASLDVSGHESSGVVVDPVDAEIEEVVGHLTAPADLSGPPPSGTCSRFNGVLSSRVQERLTLLWAQGDSPVPAEGAQTGCAWVPEGVTSMSFAQYLELDASVYGDFVNDDLATFATRFGGPCRTVEIPAAHPGAVLARCEESGRVNWSVYVPSSSGKDLWYLNVGVGDDWRGIGAGEALRDLIEVTAEAW